MEFKNLNTFRAIVETGSFTKAAEKLNHTQSTITFQIGQLEQELSTQLFEKIGRKMVLTKAGEHLIPYVDGVIQSLDRLRSFEDDLSQYQGELRIGVAETMLCYRLPDVLRIFRSQAPKARLFLQSMNCYEIRDELCDGALDLGIFYEDVGGFGATLHTYCMEECPVILAASPENAHRYPDFITPD